MSREIVVFAGPTLAEREGRAAAPALDLDWRPPAAQGDLYLAARDRPWGIAFVDGYFDRVGAVWHKEILWALSNGVHVFGAASLGALRAVECSMFGMVGVGEIYAAFAVGELLDDDEVAVVHGPAAARFATGSDAMVNIRWTLRAAVVQGVVTQTSAELLTAIAKQLHYPDRGFALVLERAARQGLSRTEIDALAEWLPSGRVDQKQLDALALLAHLDAVQREDPSPKRVRFHFQATANWEAARRALDAKRAAQSPETSRETQGEAPEETAEGVPSVRERAERRALALEVAARHQLRLDDEGRAAAIATFRVRRGLIEEADVERWLTARAIDLATLERLAIEEALIARAVAIVERDIARSVRDERLARAGKP